MENGILFDDLAAEELAEYTAEMTPAEEPGRFQIADDKAADWAVRKVLEEKAENARLHDLADAQRADIDAKMDAADKRMESRTGYLTGLLMEYFGRVPHKTTKTTEKYQLLSGALVYTRPKQTYEKDEGNLLSYLRTNGYGEYIQTVEKPMWGELKKRLTIMDGAVVVSDTGEVIPDYCVRVIEAPAKFEVK